MRSWPMVDAALRPCPATSPMATATRPSGSGTTSYQTPPTSTPVAAGTYRAARVTPGMSGRVSGSRLR